jgi:hypothetical protein
MPYSSLFDFSRVKNIWAKAALGRVKDNGVSKQNLHSPFSGLSLQKPQSFLKTSGLSTSAMRGICSLPMSCNSSCECNGSHKSIHHVTFSCRRSLSVWRVGSAKSGKMGRNVGKLLNKSSAVYTIHKKSGYPAWAGTLQAYDPEKSAQIGFSCIHGPITKVSDIESKQHRNLF